MLYVLRCMHVYLYIYMDMYIYICTCSHLCTCPSSCVDIHVFRHVPPLYLYTYQHKPPHLDFNVSINVCVHVYIIPTMVYLLKHRNKFGRECGPNSSDTRCVARNPTVSIPTEVQPTTREPNTHATGAPYHSHVTHPKKDITGRSPRI